MHMTAGNALRRNARAPLAAAIAAAIVSTIVQILLWLAFTDAFPAVLLRDARLAAAIVLGPDALSGTSDVALVWIVASAVHALLSLVYAFVIGAAVSRLGPRAALLVGAVAGAVLYAVNLHGFTALYPWFAVSRDAITFAAHVAFGMSAALVHRLVAAGDDISFRVRNRSP
jgi:hypothetical protein